MIKPEPAGGSLSYGAERLKNTRRKGNWIKLEKIVLDSIPKKCINYLQVIILI